MALPDEIISIVAQYTWTWRAPTRPDWRKGSSIIALVKSDPSWQKYKKYKEWEEEFLRTIDAKPSITTLIEVSVAICAEIFLRVVMMPLLRLK